MAEYKFNSSYFKKGDSDTVRFPNGSSIKIDKQSVLTKKKLIYLHLLKKEYVTFVDGKIATAPKEVKTTKKVKIDEPKPAKQELQEEVSTETREEE
jgi:hypothetical protein